MTRINENRFLVTWRDAEGNVRGQATKLKEDAKRLFDFAVENGAQYAEVRPLKNKCLYEYEAPAPEPASGTDTVPDDIIKSYFGRGH